MLKPSIYISILFIFILQFNQLAAQDRSNKRVQKLFQKAEKYQDQGKVDKAIKNYFRILEMDPAHIPSVLKLTGIYYNRQNYIQAADMLERAIEINPNYDPEMYYSLALIYEKRGMRGEAISQYQNYVEITPSTSKKNEKAKKRIEQLHFIIEAMKNPVKFDPQNPGPQINTRAQEYLATLDITGDIMVFTRRVNRQEDLYQSRKIEGEWQEASPLTELNTPGNEAAHCLSPDGNTLVFTSCDRRDAYGSCDLYESHFINGKWTEPAIMGKEINTRFWDSQPSITSDGQVLYFSSKRPGGYGAKDIWFSVKDENGRWTKARNAGAVINTKGNEESPFIHPDNFTLYFMSDGHPGMGNSDLFVAYFDGDQWQKPRNLGYPINSEAEEGAIRVAADGKTAFFSTDRFSGASEPKNLDIYSFTLPLEIQAQAVGYVKGRVINKENGSALSLELNLSDNTKGKLIRKIYSDNEGSFLFPIPAGYSYNLWVDHPDYIYHSEHFEAGSEHDKAEALLLEIALIPVKSGEEETEAVILNNIFFDSGSAAIDLKKSYLELDNLTSFLKKNSGIHIEIRGHTDNVGKEEDNLLLSENRAKALYDYLVLNGIDSNRLEYMGFGESRPIADNSSEEGRKLNRRTEFIVLSSLSR